MDTAGRKTTQIKNHHKNDFPTTNIFLINLSMPTLFWEVVENNIRKYGEERPLDDKYMLNAEIYGIYAVYTKRRHRSHQQTRNFFVLSNVIG